MTQEEFNPGSPFQEDVNWMALYLLYEGMDANITTHIFEKFGAEELAKQFIRVALMKFKKELAQKMFDEKNTITK